MNNSAVDWWRPIEPVTMKHPESFTSLVVKRRSVTVYRLPSGEMDREISNLALPGKVELRDSIHSSAELGRAVSKIWSEAPRWETLGFSVTAIEYPPDGDHLVVAVSSHGPSYTYRFSQAIEELVGISVEVARADVHPIT